MADSGVVWRGSPFHRYLQEVGLDDGTVAVTPWKGGDHEADGVAPVQVTVPEPSLPAPLAQRILGRIFPYLFGRTALQCAGGDIVAARKRAEGEAYIGLIAQTPLLLEEDLLFIGGVDEDIMRRSRARLEEDKECALDMSSESVRSPPQSLRERLVDAALVFAASTSAAAAPLVVLLAPSDLRPAYAAPAASALLVLAGALCLDHLLARRRDRLAAATKGSAHAANVVAIRSFVAAHELSVSLLGRSLRLIQEVELISRGFTVTPKPGPISRIEGQSEDRKCARLREGIRRVLNTNLHVLRSATLVLLKEFPLSQSVDYPGSYHAYLNPAQLGFCLSEDPDAIAAETGLLSLAYLKTLFNAVNEQRSELLRRLALIFLEECQSFHDDFVYDENLLETKEKGLPKKMQPGDLPLEVRLEVLLRMHAAMPAFLDHLTRVASWSENVLAREMRFQHADGSLNYGGESHQQQQQQQQQQQKQKQQQKLLQSLPLGLPRHCVPSMDSFTASLSDLSNHVQSVNAALSLCHHELRDLFSLPDEFTVRAQAQKMGKQQGEKSAQSQSQDTPCDAAHPQPDAAQGAPSRALDESGSSFVDEDKFRRAEAILLKYRGMVPGRIALLQDMFSESILRLEFFLHKLNPGYSPAEHEMRAQNAAVPLPGSVPSGAAIWVQEALENPTLSKKSESQKFEAFTGRGRAGDDSDESESELEALPEDVRRARLLQMREKRRAKREEQQAEELSRRAAARQAQQFISELRQVISGIEER